VNSPSNGWINGVADAPTAPHRNDPQVVRRLLATPGRWAVVGLSQNRARVAYRIAAYLRELGMQIVPVHPRAEEAYGVQGYRTLAEVPGPVDVVDVFVRSDLAGGIVDEAIAAGARAVWLQLGVVDEAAAARAAAAGLDVVMDTCPAIEAPRLGVTA
jgi:predicted CoA-binding protein